MCFGREDMGTDTVQVLGGGAMPCPDEARDIMRTSELIQGYPPGTYLMTCDIRGWSSLQ